MMKIDYDNYELDIIDETKLKKRFYVHMKISIY